jgi:hypothetical protein
LASAPCFESVLPEVVGAAGAAATVVELGAAGATGVSTTGAADEEEGAGAATEVVGTTTGAGAEVVGTSGTTGAGAVVGSGDGATGGATTEEDVSAGAAGLGLELEEAPSKNSAGTEVGEATVIKVVATSVVVGLAAGVIQVVAVSSMYSVMVTTS